MRTRYLLDTNLLVAHVSGVPDAVALIERLFAEPADLLTCDIVTCEALSGGTTEERRALRRLLDALEYVATAPSAARAAAGLRRRTGRTRNPPSLADALIAGIARDMDATVVTRNRLDFARLGARLLTY